MTGKPTEGKNVGAKKGKGMDAKKSQERELWGPRMVMNVDQPGETEAGT